MRNDIPYEYGSDLYWFCAWGKRVKKRLEEDHKNLHRWDCGVFRPDHSASKALSEYSLRYPQVVNRVNDALAHVENVFAEIDNADFDQNELNYRFEALAKRIANASQTIGSHESSKPIACKRFLFLADELTAELRRTEKVVECYPLLRQLEPNLKTIFGPSKYPRCQFKLEAFEFTVHTSHPASDDFREGRYSSIEDWPAEENDKLRQHLIDVIAAWGRSIKRTLAIEPVDSVTREEIAKQYFELGKTINGRGSKERRLEKLEPLFKEAGIEHNIATLDSITKQYPNEKRDNKRSK